MFALYFAAPKAGPLRAPNCAVNCRDPPNPYRKSVARFCFSRFLPCSPQTLTFLVNLASATRPSGRRPRKMPFNRPVGSPNAKSCGYCKDSRTTHVAPGRHLSAHPTVALKLPPTHVLAVLHPSQIRPPPPPNLPITPSHP